jgi:hypothetical protein
MNYTHMTRILFLENSSSIMEIMFDILLFVGGIIVFIYLWAYFLGGMSKLTNKRLVRHGRTMADPNTIEHLNEDLKRKGEIIASIFKKIKKYSVTKIDEHKFKNFNSSFNDVTNNKIEKLEAIDKLKNNNVITAEEFELLKKEILKM